MNEREAAIMHIVSMNNSIMGRGATLGIIWRMLWLRDNTGQRIPVERPGAYVEQIAAELDQMVDAGHLVHFPAGKNNDRDFSRYAIRR